MPLRYGYLTRHLRTRRLTLSEAVQIADRRVLVRDVQTGRPARSGPGPVKPGPFWARPVLGPARQARLKNRPGRLSTRAQFLVRARPATGLNGPGRPV
jgi:hypothetical protein